MHMLRSLAVFVAMAALAAPSAQAAPARTVTMVDPAGDANFVNDQAFCRLAPCLDESLEDGVTYGNVNDAADIRSVTISTTYTTKRTTDRRGRVVTTKVVDGFRIAVELGGAPVDGVTYNLYGQNPACPNYSIVYRRYAGGNKRTRLSGDCTAEFPGYLELPSARESATGFVITVPLRDAKIPVGTRMTDLHMFTRVVVGTPIWTFQVPQYDYVETDDVFAFGP